MDKESNKSNKSINPNKTNESIEHKGVQQVAELMQTLPTDISVIQETLINIMKEGEKEFVRENKRTMTYLEMRQLYG